MWLDPPDAKTYENLGEYMSRKLPMLGKNQVLHML